MSRIASFAFASFFSILIANAQTTVPTTTTTPDLKSLTLEAIVPIDSVDATITPNIPADVLALLTSGANELRQQLAYDAAAKTLKVTGITEPAGSPLPTPSGAANVTTLWSYTVNVDRVDISTKRNAVVFLGTVAADSTTTPPTTSTTTSATTTPFGDISGSLVSVSAGYTASTDTTAATAFTGVSIDIAGAASLFSKKGTGALSFGEGGGGGGNGVPVAVAGPKNFITGTPQFQLDGTKSKDPSGGTLTYHWTFVPVFGTSATLVGADTATPTVTVPDFSVAEGDYTFQLTVTNAAGLMATDTVTITYSPGHTDTPTAQD